MIERALFSQEHSSFRDHVRAFVREEIVPHHASWEEQKIVPRELWRKAGAAGLLCCSVPKRWDGPGLDFLHNIIVTEELNRVGATGPAFYLHSDMVATYIESFGTEAQRMQWLPSMVRGESIGALAMTEPHGGSDVRGIRTRAVRDGNDYVITGSKIWISNGQLADVVVLATKTPDDGANSITLFLVEGDRPGFRKGRNIDKIGKWAQDASELFFEDCRVPASNMLGQLGAGFDILGIKLAQERLVQAVASVSVVEAVLEWTIDYVSQRSAFGKHISEYQNTRFKLAEISSEAMAARAFVDRAIALHLTGQLDPVDAAACKLFANNLHCKAVDECLQFFGANGYSREYPISRAWVDARTCRLGGGSTEIMKTIIGRSLFRRQRMPDVKESAREQAKQSDSISH
jgi:alkylation response protein AidB-like acyl-CoA dehydrogenase